MTSENFWQNKKFLISAFGVAVLAVGIWIIQAPKAEATGAECYLSSGVCYYNDLRS